jgi:hypothetical protein
MTSYVHAVRSLCAYCSSRARDKGTIPRDIGGGVTRQSIDRRTIDAVSTAILATNLRRILLVENCLASRPAFAEKHRTRNMTICHPLRADFCLRRAVRAQGASDRRTSPVWASWDSPADGRKSLIRNYLCGTQVGSVAISPLFSPEKQGRKGCAGASVRRECGCHQQHDAGEARLCVERGETAPRQGDGDNTPPQPRGNGTGNARRFSEGVRRVVGVSLPEGCAGKQFPCRASRVGPPECAYSIAAERLFGR